MTREPDLVERLHTKIHELAYGEHEDAKLIVELRAENERLLALLKAIERHTAPGTRTWDTCLRDMGLANDLARAALEPKP